MKNKFQLLTLTPDEARANQILREETKAFEALKAKSGTKDNLLAAIRLREERDVREELLALLHEGKIEAKAVGTDGEFLFNLS